ncbi:XRE family transcriptional regulator [Novosphingobium pituita]|jgi:hypothetical protein|uniref:DUF2384 domain-containing protein n=1 Tax=Novosphingobium pituita TaxID=3056842 RepID=A0ABQ6PB92_9SPHN|nr:XRE family transcriptional regulator [Novosphingobium sp. IK01]GMM62526.1 DUF2384 domain-containing protein [Novosphingobium sp. IK01]HIQ17771.1 XRE family transcriptional regulator [Novosphingobium capsulatum]
MASAFLSDVAGQAGPLSPDVLSGRLRITKTELASALGLSRDSVSKQSRVASPATQKRLRDVVEIINRVLPWAGSELAAFAWYRSQALPSFGDLTAQDLVHAGRGEAVKRYLSRIAEGGFA